MNRLTFRICDEDERAKRLSIEDKSSVVGSCLSGCFSKPQLVVYGHATSSVSENLARVPVDVRY